jgi:outer membrane protein assembly factor BamB
MRAILMRNRMKSMKHISYIAWSILLTTAPANAENWPRFRGPTGQGRPAETGVPLQWSAAENVAWKTPLPGESWSSPIVWDDHVFVTTATDDGASCRVLALDRKSGSILWNQEVFQQALRRKEGRNTYDHYPFRTALVRPRGQLNE